MATRHMRPGYKLLIPGGLFLLWLAIFKEGHISFSLFNWPPLFRFSETSVLWRFLIGAIGLGWLIAGWLNFRKTRATAKRDGP